MTAVNDEKKGGLGIRPSRCGKAVVLLVLVAGAVSLPISKAAPAANATPHPCNASLVFPACQDDVEAAEFMLDSESNRRTVRHLLQQAGGPHLSTDALAKDHAACDPGTYRSYGGNCLPQPSNPQSRCDIYDRCRVQGADSSS